ncbi:alpha-amylase family glycosyl hydrolase [Inconstantimicrobium mannanitabidum]|uniref:Alpha-amylase n=1 Tax=Inconstantimicrobium mannanitabidum TaxID=1604901 RepID=A0ACB5RFG4_9CLOT|nr:alpha-amylase family glycosyl hydrolase [Clostridium sp. TW13]GKX67826.1 alpha-amylase [Clostridium sp. TW13]
MKIISAAMTVLLLLSGCSSKANTSKDTSKFRSPDWAKNTTIYEVNVRQYTKEGTFKAFENHLSRLKELGVDTLWFMPINPISKEKRQGTLGSYYAVQNYKEVNPEFGTIDDFKELVNKCHSMGFKVIIDWVANHTGWDNPWIKNKDWYLQNEKGEIVSPPGLNWDDVAQLNYNNKDMRKTMLEDMEYWIKDINIDGFRCDHAEGVPVDFWEEARAALDKIKPVYMLAEDDTKPEFLDKAFNTNYGFDLYKTMNGIAANSSSVASLESSIDKIKDDYSKGAYPLLFTSNHDENSWNGTEYERLGGAVKTMAALTYVVPGVPLIYTAQEFGMNKRLKFFEKDQIEEKKSDMADLYKKLNKLRKDNKALWNYDGDKKVTYLEGSNADVFTIVREKDGNTVIGVFNFTNKKINSKIKFDNLKGKYKDSESDQTVDLEKEQSVDLEAWGFKIYTK